MIKEIAVDLMWFALILLNINICMFLVFSIGLIIQSFIGIWNKKSK